MSYWMKYFNDGTVEQGTDKDIALEKASWSKGRLKGINAALLHYSGALVKVTASEIWQKDQFITGIGPYPPSRIARSLGIKVTTADIGQCAYLHHEGSHVYTLSFAPMVRGNYIRISENDVGKWLVVKINKVGTVGLLIEERYRV